MLTICLLLYISSLYGQELIKVWSAQSAKRAHPSANVCVGQDYKLVCGGVRVNWQGAGNLLTASYPIVSQSSYGINTAHCWEGKSKDHIIPSPATLDVYVIGIYDPDDELDIRVWYGQSSPAQHPSTKIGVGSGFTMICGGAKSNWDIDGGSGNLLFASYPETGIHWRAQSKDHGRVDPTTITAYAIGARFRDGRSFESEYEISTIRQSSARVPHPSIFVPVNIANDWKIIGGGGRVNWRGSGNLLTAIYPSDNLGSWNCAAKDHKYSDPSSIDCYAIAIRER